MKRETLVLVVVAVVAGLLGGYLLFSISHKEQSSQPMAGIPMSGGSPTDYLQRIAEAEKVVAQNPKNYQVWVQLGNDYFDTGQNEKAVAAYNKALELEPTNPNNPNVLTDQGVMYRKMGLFEKAIANFEKAQSMDPKHLQSLYNLGVVYATDLNQKDKAIKAWSRYLAIDSTSPQSQQIKGLIEQLQAGGAGTAPATGKWK